MIREWIKKLNYSEAFVFEGTRDDLTGILGRIKAARIVTVNDYLVKVFALESFVTLSFLVPITSRCASMI